MKDTTGFRKGPFLFNYHLTQVESIVDRPEVVPSMTDNEVYYLMGKDAVIAYMQETAKSDLSVDFGDAYINSLLLRFKAPEINWETPMASIMYCAGVNKALSDIVAYYTRKEP